MAGRTTFRFADVFSLTGFDDGDLLEAIIDDADLADDLDEVAGAMPLARDVLATMMQTLAEQAAEALGLPSLPLRRVPGSGNPIQYAGPDSDRAALLEAWRDIEMTLDDADVVRIAEGIAYMRLEELTGGARRTLN